MKDTILTMAMVILLFLGFSGIALSGEGEIVPEVSFNWQSTSLSEGCSSPFVGVTKYQLLSCNRYHNDLHSSVDSNL